MKELIEGGEAPDFSLPALEGPVKLSDFKNRKNVVLYFYPKDDTPGCTKEACDFRDEIGKFSKTDTVVLGVSPDSLESHKKFKDKYRLPFLLLSDETKEMLKSYGVWKEKSMYGRKYMGVERTTAVIDKKGKVRKIFPKVKVGGHSQEVLEFLRTL